MEIPKTAKTLRSAAIHLAYANPKLRKDLLPLIQASGPKEIKTLQELKKLPEPLWLTEEKDGKLYFTRYRKEYFIKITGNPDAAEIRKVLLSNVKEIEQLQDIEKLPKPLTLTDEGDENLYFTDHMGRKYFVKYEGHPDEAEIRKPLK